MDEDDDEEKDWEIPVDTGLFSDEVGISIVVFIRKPRDTHPFGTINPVFST